jgi:hypothetical protein
MSRRRGTTGEEPPSQHRLALRREQPPTMTTRAWAGSFMAPAQPSRSRVRTRSDPGDTPGEIGTPAVAQTLPFPLPSVHFGLWVGRRSRRLLVVPCELLRPVPLLGLPAALLLDRCRCHSSGCWAAGLPPIMIAVSHVRRMTQMPAPAL